MRALLGVALVLFLGAWTPQYPTRTTLDQTRYVHLVDSIRAEPFDDDKVEVLRRTADLSTMSCAQFVSLLPLFQWRETRLHALEVSLQAIVDPENGAQIVAAYPSVDRSRARAILRR